MATWLDLTSDSGGWSLVDTGRMHQCLEMMTNPSTQFPSLICFVGKMAKMQALRSLFPYNNVSRRCRPGIAKFHVSSTAWASEHPVFFVDVNHGINPRAPVWHTQAPVCARHRIRFDNGRSYLDLRNHFLVGTVLPFAHVLCLFADDMNGLGGVRAQLEEWSSRQMTMPPFRVVVVVTEPSDISLRAEQRRLGLSTVTVLDLSRNRDLASAARYRPLQNLLFDELDLARHERVRARLLFSATHLHALIQRAIRHAAQMDGTAFNSLHAAREGRIIDGRLAQHLSTFILMSGMHGLGSTSWFVVGIF